MKAFEDGARIRVVAAGHPLNGRYGHVWRPAIRNASALVDAVINGVHNIWL